MSDYTIKRNFLELNPKQPEFVLATSDYRKKYIMKSNIAHFYQFTAESTSMGVIPDACIDILFEKKDGKLITRIAGSRFEKGNAATEINSEYFGLRFMPGINPVSDNMKLSELVNNEECFDEMITSNDEKERLLENMYFAETFEEKISVFMNYYGKQCERETENKNSLTYFLRTKIMQANGDLKLADLCNLTGYSARYLNKKIHEDFGMNPKSLIRFIRFQKSVSTLIDTINDLNCLDTALDTGFYDQSHFIKEFKVLSGLTPTSYIENLLLHSYDKKLHIT